MQVCVRINFSMFNISINSHNNYKHKQKITNLFIQKAFAVDLSLETSAISWLTSQYLPLIRIPRLIEVVEERGFVFRDSDGNE